jgi:hypothetical protein
MPVSEPVIDLKGALLSPDGATPGLALRADYKPPQVGGGEHTGHDLVGLAIATWQVDAWAWHVNAGGAWRGAAAAGARGALVGAVGVAWRATDSLTAGLEVIAEAAPSLGNTEIEAMAALQWEPAGGRIVSLGLGPAWASGGPGGWHATLGLTAAFGAP